MRLIKAVLYIISFLISQNALAQLCFDAVQTRGCAPFTVQIQECVGANVDASSLLYDYDFETGGSINATSDTFFTYNTPGLYTILQLGNVGANGDTLARVNYIEVLPSPAPVYDVYRCDSNRIVVDIIGDNYEEYFVDWGDGNTDTVLPLNQISHKYSSGGTKNIEITGNYVPGDCGGSISFDVSTLNLVPEPVIEDFTYSSNDLNDSVSLNYNTASSIFYDLQISSDTLNSYQLITRDTSDGNPFTYNDTSENGLCYRLIATDACGNQKISETICTVKLFGEAENNQNILTWLPYPLPINIIEWEFYKDSILTSNYSPQFDTLNYIDTQIVCNRINCYQLNVKLFGGVTSISNVVCLKGLSLDTPEALNNFYVSIENNETLLRWDEDSLAAIYRMKRGFTKVSIFDSTDSDSYTLLGPEQDVPRICYTADFLDECRNRSDQIPINCPVEITVVLLQDDSREVHWLPYKGWQGNIESYTLEKLDENDDVYFSREFDNTTFEYRDEGIDTVLQNLRYRVKATLNSDENIESYSLIYEIEQVFKMFFPNAFSPNGDGLNDEFGPIGEFADEYLLQIHSRWGELIFVSRDPKKNWDGTIDGKEAPEGVYIFKVDAADELGRTFSHKSTLTLTR